MSRFKFRVWDKNFQAYIPLSREHKDSAFSLDGNGKLVDIMNYGVPVIVADDDRFIIEQFTGRLSVDGKEICEGDIVKCNRYDSFRSYNQGEVIYVNELGSFVIATNKKSKIIEQRFTDDEVFLYLYDWPKLTILGNIHNNPELLELRGK